MSLEPRDDCYTVTAADDATIIKLTARRVYDLTLPDVTESMRGDGRSRPKVRLDLAGVEFLTSTVLGALIGLHKRVRSAGGHLTVENIAPVLYEIFEVTRLDQLLDVRREGANGQPAGMPA